MHDGSCDLWHVILGSGKSITKLCLSSNNSFCGTSRAINYMDNDISHEQENLLCLSMQCLREDNPHPTQPLK